MKVKSTYSICDKCGKSSDRKTEFVWMLDNENYKNKGKSCFCFCDFCHQQLQVLWSKAKNDTMVKFVGEKVEEKKARKRSV